MRAELRLVDRSMTAITWPFLVTGMASARTGTPLVQSGSLSRQIRCSVRAVSSSAALPWTALGADHVVGERRGPRRRPHLRDGHPAASRRAVWRPDGHPQDQVGERQVGEELPVGHQRVQPLQVGAAEAGVAPGEVGKRRHAPIMLHSRPRHFQRSGNGPRMAESVNRRRNFLIRGTTWHYSPMEASRSAAPGCASTRPPGRPRACAVASYRAPPGAALLDLASNDYLGLSGDPRLARGGGSARPHAGAPARPAPAW